MNWNQLTSKEQLDIIKEESKTQKVLIFKHSTRCSISSMAKNRLEREWKIGEEALKPYYLDLIAFRDVSNNIAEQFNVPHQSPQVLVIDNGNCIYDTSHMGIRYGELERL